MRRVLLLQSFIARCKLVCQSTDTWSDSVPISQLFVDKDAYSHFTLALECNTLAIMCMDRACIAYIYTRQIKRRNNSAALNANYGLENIYSYTVYMNQ